MVRVALAIVSVLLIAQPANAQRQVPISSNTFVIKPCPSGMLCTFEDDVPVPPGGRAPLSFLSQVASGLGYASSLAMEVGTRTAGLQIDIKHRVRRIDATTARVDTLFLDLSFLNRAAVELDSISSVATDYITSLQAAPLTFRGQLPAILPILKLPVIATGDFRLVPFADSTGQFTFGQSGHLFLSASFTRYSRRVNQSGEVVDRGEFYFDPTIFGAHVSNALGNAVFEDQNTNTFAGAELRVGFRWTEDRDADIGLIGRCSFEKMVGPPCRLTLSMGR